jgi:hypothetical protein
VPAFGRSLSDFPKLSAAEKQLVANCRLGTVTELAQSVPTRQLAKLQVRGGLIRFLALGGDAENPVHENGILLSGAWIDDVLDLDDCVVLGPLSLTACHIGPFFLRRARLAQLSLGSSRLREGLVADSLECRGDVLIGEGVKADAEIILIDASIGGNLVCSGAKFNQPDGSAVSAERIKVKGGVFFRDGFVAKGCVALSGAHIGGSLECNTASFECLQGGALIVEGANIKGSVFLRKTRASGSVRFVGATVDGHFECDGAVFSSKVDDSLSLDGAEIKGPVFLRAAFAAIGTVRLTDANIGSNLECSTGQFDGNGRTALQAERLKVKGNVFLDQDFISTGLVSLLGAAVDGSLFCDHSSLLNEEGTALDLEGARIGQKWHWRDVNRFEGNLDVRLMHTGSLFDDAASWQMARGRIVLDGFRYDRLARGAPTDAPTRIAWLKSQEAQDLGPDFRPQPWEQCASVLKAMGHPNAARQVLIEKERMEQQADRHGKPGSLRRLSYSLYGWLTAYGYWPINLLRLTIGLYLVATLAFWIAANPRLQPGTGAHYIASAATPQPSPDCVAQAPSIAAGRECRPQVPGYGSFFAPAHVLETMLPISTLRRSPEWRVRVEGEDGGLLFPGLVLQGFSWLVSLWGWLASILLILWLGKLIRRD